VILIAELREDEIADIAPGDGSIKIAKNAQGYLFQVVAPQVMGSQEARIMGMIQPDLLSLCV